ncbi:3-deoxy-D-manno-octulosonic-acid transferase [Pseudomonas aeruginosa]|nr:3-deoxy-D-manno-octulosonic-acid transferase [Pseudomonas aeruginosa]
MNRTLYTLLFHLGLPLVALRLWWRARQAPAYAKRIGERFSRPCPRCRPAASGCTLSRWARASPPRRWCGRCWSAIRSCRSPSPA